VSIDVAIPGDRNLIKKDAVNNSKFEDPITEIQRTRNVRTKSDIGNKWGDWDHFKALKTVREQHTGKARN